ncbi:hypothetical protein ACSSS7_003337 [Eimeria intestinalis]
MPEGAFQQSKEGFGDATQSESEVQEGWENIFGDDAEHTADVSVPLGLLAEALLSDRDVTRISDRGTRTNEADGSVVCSSPPTEFEYVPDSALRDARRLLRLSQRQQLRGWGWAYAAVASAREGRISTCRAAAANGPALEAIHPVNGGERGSPAKATAAEHSFPVLPGGLRTPDGSRRRASSSEPACVSRACQGTAEATPKAPLVLSGWRGRWQLTSLDSPRGSVSSYCSAETKRNSPTPKHLTNCVTLLGTVPAQRPAQEGSAISVAHIFEPPRSCEEAPISAISGPTQNEADDLKEHPYGSAPSAGEPTVELKSPSVPASSSDPPGNGDPEERTANLLQDLLLHRAQQQLESECRRRVQRKDWRLNILVTALPGIDSIFFTQQMFAEWQQVARQEIACGEEYLYRLQSSVPFVEAKQVSRAKESLRVQLAGSDLATLEEMLLPETRVTGGPESVSIVCSHCQQRHMHDNRQNQDSQLQKGDMAGSRGDSGSERCAGSSRTASSHYGVHGSDESKSSRSNISASEVDINWGTKSRGGSRRRAFQGPSPAQARVTGESPTPTRSGRANSNHRRWSSNRGCDHGNSVLYRGAVHLPLVLHLPASSEIGETGTSCARWFDSEDCSSIATPATLRQMLVDASAVLLRERAEYGCFLPFLFQHQLQADQASKLQGLRRWEEDVERQKRQRQHVEALIGVRQGQIDRSTAAIRKVQLQKQLNNLRQQLQKMQQQLLQLQQQKFLKRLLREEAEGAQAFSVHHGRLLLPCTSRQAHGKEEPAPHIAQMGLALACVMGVGAILFTSIKNSSQ